MAQSGVLAHNRQSRILFRSSGYGTLQDEVRRICSTTGQTVFMITHEVDEAIYLADRVVLMTNGPGAVLAEIVENPLPRERKRDDVHKHPLYYGVRNHITASPAKLAHNQSKYRPRVLIDDREQPRFVRDESEALLAEREQSRRVPVGELDCRIVAVGLRAAKRPGASEIAVGQDEPLRPGRIGQRDPSIAVLDGRELQRLFQGLHGGRQIDDPQHHVGKFHRHGCTTGSVKKQA
jgi:hypothetical protein